MSGRRLHNPISHYYTVTVQLACTVNSEQCSLLCGLFIVQCVVQCVVQYSAVQCEEQCSVQYRMMNSAVCNAM